MTRLAVSVEGQTEEEFVKQVLAEHLRARRVESTPILLGRARGRPGGGNVSSDRLVADMAVLYYSFDAVTSLVDFYGFREGLLFSDVEVFGTRIDFPPECVPALRRVREQFPTPEDVNDHYETAPSRRIASAIPRYRKVVHGAVLAGKIGLDRIRVQCPRFHGWLTRLEALDGD